MPTCNIKINFLQEKFQRLRYSANFFRRTPCIFSPYILHNAYKKISAPQKSDCKSLNHFENLPRVQEKRNRIQKRIYRVSCGVAQEYPKTQTHRKHFPPPRAFPLRRKVRERTACKKLV